MKKQLITLLFITTLLSAAGQIYKDPQQPVEARVADLLSQMTPEEKFWQLFMIPGDIDNNNENYTHGIFGFQVNTLALNDKIAGQMLHYSAGNSARETAFKINNIQRFFIEESRLGIPIIAFDEALHGLVRTGATVFPQSIGLAATWNPDLMHKVANAIARECKTRGIRQVLSPVVNTATDVRWGRTEETYGEDPYLTAEMGVAYVSAFEKQGIIATPKHFVANVGEGGRDSYPISWNERLLREIYLPPFEACIKRGGARSIMTSYNTYDGTPCTANSWLLRKILKGEWQFNGMIISDAGGTGGANVLHFTATDYPDATAQSIKGGLDVIFQTSYDHHTLFSPPFTDGTIAPEVIDEAVGRVLKAKFDLDLFDHPYVNPDETCTSDEMLNHRELAKQAARESIVLLKKQNNVLPISQEIKSIAVIGPDADEARLGGYSGSGNQKTSILEGLRKRAGSVKIRYAHGCSRENNDYVTIPSEALLCTSNNKKENGLSGAYFNNLSFTGAPVFIRTDKQIDFQWTLFSPDPTKLTYDFYSVRWTGTLTAPESGIHRIGIDGNDGYRLYLDGKMILDNWEKRSKKATLVNFNFEKNRAYDIRIEFYEPVGNAWFRLVWDLGTPSDQSKQIEQAVALAAESDMVIVAVGIEEGEFRDRAYLNLPGHQEELIKKASATGKPVVVLLVGGSAVTMNNWLDDAAAILAVWYPGEEGGSAVAEVLFGDYNPAGRLPITFPVFEGQLPLTYNHKPTGRGDDYVNLTGQPLFPFGFGLSYTTFAYSDIALTNDHISAGDSTKVSVLVTNTGSTAGDEVVQFYLRDELSSVARPLTELKGFRRIHLLPGDSAKVSFNIDAETLSMLNQHLQKVVEPGTFRIMIGASAKDIRQRIILTVKE